MKILKLPILIINKELIDELVQVLDEDAESLVNELWDYIETMV